MRSWLRVSPQRATRANTRETATDSASQIIASPPGYPAGYPGLARLDLAGRNCVQQNSALRRRDTVFRKGTLHTIPTTSGDGGGMASRLGSAALLRQPVLGTPRDLSITAAIAQPATTPAGGTPPHDRNATPTMAGYEELIDVPAIDGPGP